MTRFVNKKNVFISGNSLKIKWTGLSTEHCDSTIIVFHYVYIWSFNHLQKIMSHYWRKVILKSTKVILKSTKVTLKSTKVTLKSTKVILKSTKVTLKSTKVTLTVFIRNNILIGNFSSSPMFYDSKVWFGIKHMRQAHQPLHLPRRSIRWMRQSLINKLHHVIFHKSFRVH
jgi:hypothetical protein